MKALKDNTSILKGVLTSNSRAVLLWLEMMKLLTILSLLSITDSSDGKNLGINPVINPVSQFRFSTKDLKQI